MNFNFLLDNAASSADAAQQQNPGQIWMLLGMYALLACYLFLYLPS